MTKVVIDLAGVPVAKGRPKFARVGKGKDSFSVAYTPAKTRHYENALRHAAQQVMDGRRLLTGPLRLSVEVRRQIPRSWSGKKTAEALAGRLWPTTKPDLDNHEKVCDALNGVVWIDDAQIVNKVSSKIYSDKPGLRVEVSRAVGEDDLDL